MRVAAGILVACALASAGCTSSEPEAPIAEACASLGRIDLTPTLAPETGYQGLDDDLAAMEEQVERFVDAAHGSDDPQLPDLADDAAAAAASLYANPLDRNTQDRAFRALNDATMRCMEIGINPYEHLFGE